MLLPFRTSKTLHKPLGAKLSISDTNNIIPHLVMGTAIFPITWHNLVIHSLLLLKLLLALLNLSTGLDG